MDEFESGEASSDMQQASIGERLASIDHAYVNSTRETCVRLVDNLYAYFDEMTGGAMSCLAIAGMTMFGMLSALD